MSLHLFVLALDRIVVSTAIRTSLATLTISTSAGEIFSSRSTTLAVDLLADLMEGLLKRLARGLDTLHIVSSESSTHIGHLRLQLALLLAGNTLGQFANALLGTIGGAISQVALLDLFLAALVISCMRLGIADHLIDLILREAA